MDKETKDYIDQKIDKSKTILNSGTVPSGFAGDTESEPDPFANWRDKDIYPVWKDETGSHTIENLDGIHVPVIDGTEILVYPEYEECKFLPKSNAIQWTVASQGHPLYRDIDQHAATDELLELGSKAAGHVRKYDKDMPLPIQLLAIARYQKRINDVSKILHGDTLSFRPYELWSCLREIADYVWCVDKSNGTFSSLVLHDIGLSVPVSLVKRH